MGQALSRVSGLARRRVTRRRFVAAGVVALATAELVRALPATTARPAEGTPPSVDAYRWDLAEAIAASAGSGEFVSSPLRAAGPVNAVGVLCSVPLAGLALRMSPDGLAWGQWLAATWHDEASRGPTSEGWSHSDLLVGRGWRYVQCRFGLGVNPRPAVTVVALNTGAGPAVDALPFGAQGSAPTVVSRASWGCNEAYRFNGNGVEIWPPEYRNVTHVIVHHSVTGNYEADPGATVRAIYYYHAVQLGWGDIGYNLLVDWRGVVYEGRYGGDNVVGGHALQHNYGSLGIGCLGTFGNTSTSVAPPSAMQTAVASLIAHKYPCLDAHASAFLVDRVAPVVAGHRDVYQTACPGDYLYAALPALRDAVTTAQAGLCCVGGVQPTIIAASIWPERAGPGDTLNVYVTVAAGCTTVLGQGPDSGFVYAEGQTYASLGLPGVSGRWRVAVGSSTDTEYYPYRWGLPATLPPGAQTTLSCPIRLGPLGTRQFWVGLIGEPGTVAVHGYGATTVKVLPAYCLSASAPSRAPAVAASTTGSVSPVRLPLITTPRCD